MAIALMKLYDALRAADAPEDKARAAAEEVAGFETRINKIEGDLNLLKWMVGTNVALTIAVLIRVLLSHGG